jgi:hypothetical protein
VIVVSNTSPITNLAAISQLPLLQQLYETIIIPQAVYDEIVAGSIEVQTELWIQTQQVANYALVTALQLELDWGEAEAIALAIELKADLLLLDERRGRTVASRFGLKFTGILGVLIEAKHKGAISAVKPVLDSLILTAGFWVTEPLYSRVIQTAGE